MSNGTSKPKIDVGENFGVQSTKNEISIRIRDVVREAGGNAVVSEKSGVPLRTVGNYTTGLSEPKVVSLSKIASICGVSMDWLATGKGPKRPSKPGSSIDFDRLSDAIQGVDELQETRKIKFTPEKKTELILSIYEAILDEEE